MFLDMNPTVRKGAIERAAQLSGHVKRRHFAVAQSVAWLRRELVWVCPKSLKSVRLYAQFWDQQVERVLSENLEPVCALSRCEVPSRWIVAPRHILDARRCSQRYGVLARKSKKPAPNSQWICDRI